MEAKPTEENAEGFPCYVRPIEEQVVSVLTTGSTANLFYAVRNVDKKKGDDEDELTPDVKENIKNMVAVLEQEKNDEFLAKAVVYARTEGFTRELPIAGLVLVSKRDPELFKKICHTVCRNPHDWQKFIDICRSRLIREGIGRSGKREIVGNLAGMSTYHALKYPTAVKDMINVARPSPKVNPAVIDYIKNGKITKKDEKLKALDALKNAKTDATRVKQIAAGSLPYEVVTGSVAKMTPEIWEALLYQAPYFNLLRNLNNFTRNGVFDKKENLQYAVEYLTNDAAIAKSMLFPFRYYAAYAVLEDSPHKEKLQKALEKAMKKSLKNVPTLPGTVAIAADTSGSMSGAVTGDRSNIQCIDLVGVFTGVMMQKCENTPILLPFDGDIRDNIAKAVYAEEGGILKIAEHFTAGGSTSLSAPIERLIRDKTKVDTLIAFTDNEEWVGRGFVDAFREYKKKVSPKTKAYLVTLMPYQHAPVPANEKDVYMIYGWSDNILKYISAQETDQVTAVKQTPLK